MVHEGAQLWDSMVRRAGAARTFGAEAGELAAEVEVVAGLELDVILQRRLVHGGKAHVERRAAAVRARAACMRAAELRARRTANSPGCAAAAKRPARRRRQALLGAHRWISERRRAQGACTVGRGNNLHEASR